MGTQTVTEPVAGSETKLAPLYRVLIHNDDVTPMDFVVRVLEEIFKLDAARAVMAGVKCRPLGRGLSLGSIARLNRRMPEAESFTQAPVSREITEA